MIAKFSLPFCFYYQLQMLKTLIFKLEFNLSFQEIVVKKN